jgi:hypothetical protein
MYQIFRVPIGIGIPKVYLSLFSIEVYEKNIFSNFLLIFSLISIISILFCLGTLPIGIGILTENIFVHLV